MCMCNIGAVQELSKFSGWFCRHGFSNDQTESSRLETYQEIEKVIIMYHVSWERVHKLHGCPWMMRQSTIMFVPYFTYIHIILNGRNYKYNIPAQTLTYPGICVWISSIQWESFRNLIIQLLLLTSPFKEQLISSLNTILSAQYEVQFFFEYICL